MKRDTTDKGPAHELSATEKRLLRKAHAIVDEIAWIHRATPQGKLVAGTVSQLAVLMTGDLPEPEDG